MKRKERIKEKVIESWKYYPISLLSPSVFIVIACAIIVFFIQQSLTDGTAKYLLDFLWKAAVGYAIKELMVITSGNPDIVTLLTSLNKVYYSLAKLKKKINSSVYVNNKETLDSIENIDTEIEVTMGRYTKDYDVINFAQEAKYIDDVKKRIDAQGVVPSQPLLQELNKRVERLENSGYSETRGLTGTTDQHYFVKK